MATSPSSGPGGGSGSGTSVTILNYTEKSSTVTVSATAEATPTTILTASAGVVVDGLTLICVEFYAPTTSLAISASLLINLWDDTAAAALGRIWAASESTAGTSPGIYGKRYFTPAAGTRTYSIRGWRSGSNEDVVAGAGGLTAYFPMFIRITSGG